MESRIKIRILFKSDQISFETISRVYSEIRQTYILALVDSIAESSPELSKAPKRRLKKELNNIVGFKLQEANKGSWELLLVASAPIIYIVGILIKIIAKDTLAKNKNYDELCELLSLWLDEKLLIRLTNAIKDKLSKKHGYKKVSTGTKSTINKDKSFNLEVEYDKKNHELPGTDEEMETLINEAIGKLQNKK